MLEGYDIIVVGGVNWHANLGPQQQLALRLAKNNHILFVNPPISHLTRIKMAANGKYLHAPQIEKLKDVTIMTPRVLPLMSTPTGWKMSRRLYVNRIKRVANTLGYDQPILIVAGLKPELFGQLNERASVYLCDDDYIAGARYMGSDPAYVEFMEIETMNKTDVMIVISEELFTKKSPFHQQIFCIPNGCDTDHFSKYWDVDFDPPVDIRNIPYPIIGFMGYINNRIDFDLMTSLAVNKPDWSFVFIGETVEGVDIEKVARLEACSNVFMLGFKDHHDLPKYVHTFDVCMIPYRNDDFNRMSCPIKLFEYLATGKPIVSQDIPAARKFSELIYLFNDEESIVRAIEQALSETGLSASYVSAERITSARAHDWNVRAEQLSSILLDTINRKRNHLKAS